MVFLACDSGLRSVSATVCPLLLCVSRQNEREKKNGFCAPETHTLQPFPFSKDLKTGNGGRVVPSVEKEKWIIVDRV